MSETKEPIIAVATKPDRHNFKTDAPGGELTVAENANLSGAWLATGETTFGVISQREGGSVLNYAVVYDKTSPVPRIAVSIEDGKLMVQVADPAHPGSIARVNSISVEAIEKIAAAR